MRKFFLFIISACLWLYAPFAYAADPLFANDTVIQIRIEAPFKKLVRTSKRSTAPYAAKLLLENGAPETHDISLSARGKSRRTNGLCRFPPLRVKFTEKPQAGSYFKGQKSLKLVTHCKTPERYQQNALLEYSLYKIYNEITPHSLKVRLANITYYDSDTGKIHAQRYGFFIEDMDDAAKRNGMKEVDITNIASSQLSTSAAAKAALFNYMAGNLDFSMTKGPPGKDCCHNGKLMGANKRAANGLIYVPYDFDQTGYVDAPYATPPENVKVKSVRTRVYRGYCRHNDAVRIEAQNMLRNRNRILSVIDRIPELDTKYRAKSKNYLIPFFDTLADPAVFEKKLLKKCRG